MSGSQIPDDLQYTTEHEWVQVRGRTARVGITDYAQDALGDVVYVSLPEINAVVTAGQACAEVESTKSVSEVYAPLAGTISAVNSAVLDAPQLLNSDPYQQGWLFEVDVNQDAPQLLSSEQYAQHLRQ